MGGDAWNGTWFSSFYFALAKMTYAIQTWKAPSLHKFPVILATVEWAVTNSLFGGFLVALSAQLGEAKAENIQTADPAFIRDSWVSCGLWACSAHSSDVAKQALGGLIHMKHDCVHKWKAFWAPAGSREIRGETAFIEGMCSGSDRMFSGVTGHIQNI